ncbi:MAG: MurR/RpiR family transcriptional regulator [Lactimicrobium sp.]|uniref:MurR/RpiR family transcriptional regulator n=1 Tax=Lactimicrobium sp. TaxID=2563780 RepID=UPI002F35C99C
MKNVTILLRENADYLNPAEKAAAEYILKNSSQASSQSVQQIAASAFVSPAAVVRMCKSLGFKGFKEFKTALTADLASQNITFTLSQEDIQKGDSLNDIIHKITQKNIQSLYDTLRLMDADELEKCVKAMQKAKQVKLFGLGASLIVAKDAYLKFLRINKTCIFNDDWHAQLICARNSTPEDLAIIISYSGETKEMITCAHELKKNGTPIIAITRCVATSIAKMADMHLYTTANESLFRSGSMSSRISQLNIIDILYTAYANSEYDYAMTELKKTHIQKEHQDNKA